MKYETATILLIFFGLAIAAPVPEDISKDSFPPVRMLRGREVPQEHSHEQFLTSVRASLDSNNPAGIVDPVFGLLGDAAAAGGLGKITDVNCLQQATADQAFTNAKAAGDIQGQVDALIYRALERNTGKVGLASTACTSIQAVNPEISAISQHQDPASPGAAAINKAIVLELAKQIQAVGGNPQDALKSGTFAPGSLSDTSGKGNTCDTTNDPIGCIFTQNLLVPDATAAEIEAAVGGAGASGASSIAAVTPSATSTPASVETAASACAAPVTVTVTATSVTSSPASVLDFGTCTDPAIIFGFGFDGRNTDAFEPANKASFNHGSALNIGVIASFICGQLQSPCNAAADAISACAAAQAAAATQTGQAAADAFNAALGVSAGAASTVATSSVTSPAATSPAAAAAPATTSAAAASGSNVQTFTGDLGGLPPPVIFTAGAARPFAVDGTTDINKGAAIQRSCSVQHNSCADAANSGALAGGVGQCDQQLNACNAAGGV